MEKCVVTDHTEDRIYIKCGSENELDDLVSRIEQRILEHSWVLDYESSTEIALKKPKPEQIPDTHDILTSIEYDVIILSPPNGWKLTDSELESLIFDKTDRFDRVFIDKLAYPDDEGNNWHVFNSRDDDTQISKTFKTFEEAQDYANEWMVDN
jgi:hypothetical protein